MPKRKPQSDRLDNFIGTRRKPVEIFVNQNHLGEMPDGDVESRTLHVAFRGLQERFGFGLQAQNLTVCDYADMLRYLEPTDGDAKSNISILQSPTELEWAYLGPRATGQLMRLKDDVREERCDALESFIVTHQFILAKICRDVGGAVIDDEDTHKHMLMAGNKRPLTSSFCRYYVKLPSMCGTQDFLRMIDAPIGSVRVGYDRSTLFSAERVYPSKSITLPTYCWPNTVMGHVGSQNGTLYVIYTLLPSITGGLVAENIDEIGIHVTVSEEIVRGHTGRRNKRGKYYEWVAPVLSGLKGKRVRTFYLSVGSSLVLPSTFAVRLGAHCRDAVVVFVHAVRVWLPDDDKGIFLKRPKSYLTRDQDEYENVTEFLEPDYEKSKDYIRWGDFYDMQKEPEFGVVGTIPSVTSIPVNTKERERLVESACHVKLGSGGVSEAYKRTPVMRIGRRAPGNIHTDVEPDDAQLTPEPYFVEDVPYAHFERVLGNTLRFPLSLERIAELEMARNCSSDDEEMTNGTESSSESQSVGSDDGSSDTEQLNEEEENNEDDMDEDHESESSQGTTDDGE